MSKRTRDVAVAESRLRAAHGHLVCGHGHKYGGSIASDIEAVLWELTNLQTCVDELMARCQVLEEAARALGEPTPQT
jgi:hypothetical protein